jgi:cytochrome c556
MGFLKELNLFGMNGTEIYHNFRGGTGDDARGLMSAATTVALLGKRYNDRMTSITQLTTTMESAWQGNAAGAAQRGAGPLAVEHGLAQTGMTTASDTLKNQATAFLAAKQAVTEVPPTPEKPGIWDNVSSFGGASRNYDQKMNQVNTANDNNVAVMEQYENTTSTNTSAMPTTYGRITDDYAQIGVDKPTPPPPSEPYNPNIPGTSNPGNSRGQGTTRSGTGSTTGTGTNSNNNRPPGTGNQNRPPGNTQTNPSNNRPPTNLPPRGPFPPNQNPGQNPGGNPALPGMMPPPAFGPGGGGPGGGPRGGGGFGPRGSGGSFGPGGSGPGSPGSGGRGPGGGFGPGAGGAAAAAEGAAGRGGMGGPGGRGGMGGMGGGMGAGGKKGEGEEDGQHERPSFLVEPDPHDTFGTDEVTAPPVIGE